MSDEKRELSIELGKRGDLDQSSFSDTATVSNTQPTYSRSRRELEMRKEQQV